MKWQCYMYVACSVSVHKVLCEKAYNVYMYIMHFVCSYYTVWLQFVQYMYM